MLLPSVTYWVDNENQLLEIKCSSVCEGETFLYNSVGSLIDYEPSVNATFDISSYPVGLYVILVSTYLWEATGTISLP